MKIYIAGHPGGVQGSEADMLRKGLFRSRMVSFWEIRETAGAYLLDFYFGRKPRKNPLPGSLGSSRTSDPGGRKGFPPGKDRKTRNRVLAKEGKRP